MLIGVLSGVTGGVKSESNFEFALKLLVNVASLIVSLATLFMPLIDTSSSITLHNQNEFDFIVKLLTKMMQSAKWMRR